MPITAGLDGVSATTATRARIDSVSGRSSGRYPGYLASSKPSYSSHANRKWKKHAVYATSVDRAPRDYGMICSSAALSSVYHVSSGRAGGHPSIVLVTPESAILDDFMTFLTRQRLQHRLDRILIDECPQKMRVGYFIGSGPHPGDIQLIQARTD